MIMDIFLLFTILSLVLTVLGYYMDNELMLIFGLLGFVFMAFPLINGNLEYRAGYNITTLNDNTSTYCHYEIVDIETVYKYGNNYTSYHWDYSSPSPSIQDVNLFHTYEYYNYSEICENATIQQKVNDYETYSDTRWYGIFFIFISLSGLFYYYKGYREGRRKEED